MKIILFQPNIPQNAGNVIRTCSVTGTDLVFVKPLGFSTSSRWLKRAGLDYFEGVDITMIDDLDEYLEKEEMPFHFFSSKGKVCYTEKEYGADDILIFGSETEGLPQSIHDKYSQHFVTIPMKEDKRCLNLATSAGIALFEALRQNNFQGIKGEVPANR